MSLNICIFEGRLTRKPETQTFSTGSKKTSFGLAVEGRPFKNASGERVKPDPMFIDCESWGQGGEIIEQYFDKGSVIQVKGELRLEVWEDKNTNLKRSKHVLRVESFEFPLGGNSKKVDVDNKENVDNNEKPKSKAGRKPKEKQQVENVTSDVHFEAEQPTDDDIPF